MRCDRRVQTPPRGSLSMPQVRRGKASGSRGKRKPNNLLCVGTRPPRGSRLTEVWAGGGGGTVSKKCNANHILGNYFIHKNRFLRTSKLFAFFAPCSEYANLWTHHILMPNFESASTGRLLVLLVLIGLGAVNELLISQRRVVVAGLRSHGCNAWRR